MKRSRSPDEPPLLDSPDSQDLDNNDDSNDELLKVNNRSSETPPPAKITELDPSSANSSKFEIHCSLPPHKQPLVFSSYDEYETHHRNQHTNRCLECRKNFPSSHLLTLHIEETHDSFVAIRREKGERTYACFVEGCDKVCREPYKRKMHLIAKHMYPKNFFFAVTRDGIDGRRSLLLEGTTPRHKRPGAASSSTVATASLHAEPFDEEAQQCVTAAVSEKGPEEQCAKSADHHPIPAVPEFAHAGPSESPRQKPDVEMEDLSAAISQLQFVPRSVRFGRGGKKSGFAKR
ncbi:hypothetical protein QBC38DRAFT_476496 [Podospora fimiseda]|uniref:C2H2-type domain-containing protein n=1 Tax=Podospora fimiseda TaxID=252190 RepID=A0AAN7GZX9_9PEZI|nr:hypothetical protein QBC38DRAFT_476496 [Podospora fimiseda]